MKTLIALPAVALTVIISGTAAADPPRPALDALLPDTTCEFVTLPDLNRWDDARFRTFGVFLEHSAPQPYLRDAEPRRVQLYDMPAPLAAAPSSRYVAEQIKPAAGEPVDLRWFVQPFLRAEAARVIVPWPKKQGKDPLKILKPEGFHAIKAAGGCAGFGPGERLLTYRS